jgi:WD40 repeat protein
VELSYSPDGRRIVAKMGEQLHLWDAVTGQPIASLSHHKYPEWDVHCHAQFDPAGQRLVSGLMEEVSWWDAATGKLVAVLRRYGGHVAVVACSPDGKRIAAATPVDPVVRLWDGETGKEMAVLGGHTSAIMRLLFSSSKPPKSPMSTRMMAMTTSNSMSVKPRRFRNGSPSMARDLSNIVAGRDCNRDIVWSKAVESWDFERRIYRPGSSVDN